MPLNTLVGRVVYRSSILARALFRAPCALEGEARSGQIQAPRTRRDPRRSESLVMCSQSYRDHPAGASGSSTLG